MVGFRVPAGVLRWGIRHDGDAVGCEGRFVLSHECPHLRVEIWGPDFVVRCGPPTVSNRVEISFELSRMDTK
jgi:hypothetical protein